MAASGLGRELLRKYLLLRIRGGPRSRKFTCTQAVAPGVQLPWLSSLLDNRRNSHMEVNSEFQHTLRNAGRLAG